MLYQEYKEKLYKRKKVYDGLWRFRFLILAAAILIVASVSALMGITGMTYDFAVSKTELVYGETIAASAECIFGDATLEYRKVGDGQWTNDIPRYAGTYECRPCSESVFGTKRAGKTVTFEILPIQVDVKVYGSDLRIGDDLVFFADMKYGDKLSVSEYTVAYEDGTFSVSFDPSAIAVTSSDGKDVTSSYKFNALGKSMNVVKRPMRIEMPNGSAQYDGEPHAFSDAEVEGLLPEHTFEITYKSFTEAGAYRGQNTVETYKILDAEGQDITDIYAVSCVAGTVDITRREICVGATPADVVYDGQAHVYESFGLLDGTTLADGHTLEVTDFVSGTEVGSYENTAKIAVYDGENDVTKNYDIIRNFSPLKIVQKPVTVTTGDHDFVYNGEEHTFEDVSISQNTPLANGHALKVTSPSKAFYAGKSQNAPTFEIVDENDKPVTKNYAVTRNFGEITVNKRAIKIETCSYERWYSGKPNIPSDDEAIIDDENLLVGQDRFEISYGNVTMTQAKEDGYENAPEIKIKDASGQDVSDSYDVSYTFGAIKVNRRTLHITTGDATFDYDGGEHFDESYTLGETDEYGHGLAKGESLSVTSHTTVKKFVEGGEKNALEFAVKAANADATQNYIFGIVEGTLSVNKRPLNLTTESGTHEYDGQAFYVPQILAPSNIVSGQTYYIRDIVPKNTVTNVGDGTKDNDFTFALHIFDGDEETTGNYEIDYANITHGKISVTQRAVILTTGSASGIIYDAKPHSAESIEGDRLVTGHEVKAEYPSFVTVGDYSNEPTGAVKILSGETDVTDNYNIDLKFGKVTIKQRPLTITTKGGEFVYNASPKSVEECDTSIGEKEGLADGHTLTLSYPEWTDAGESYENIPASAPKITAGDDDVTGNYEIDWEYGKVTIKKRPLAITTNGDEFVYDGTPKKVEVCTSKEGENVGLVKGQYLMLSYPSWTDVSEDENGYLNEPDSIRVTGSNGEGDFTKNYDIDVNCGYVKIKPYELVVTARTETFTYDGQYHTYGASTFECTLPGGHELAISDPQSFIDVGTYDVQPAHEDIQVLKGERQVPMRDFSLTINKGTVTIEKLHIDITTSSYMVWYTGLPNAPKTNEAAISNLEGLLVEGDEFELTYEDMTAANEDGYENAPEIKIMAIREGAPTDVAQLDYDITTTWGKIIVKKRILNVTITKDKSLVYNGKEQGAGPLDSEFYSYPNENEGYGLADGETLSVENSAALNKVGDKAFELVYKVSKNGGDDETTDNYKIETIENRDLIIVQRPVTLTTATKSRKYDGTPLSDYTVTALAGSEDSGIVEGQRLECAKTSDVAELIDCGTVKNHFEYDVHIFADADKKDDVTGCYKISKEDGTLSVTQRALTLSTANTSVMYDAAPHGFVMEDISYGEDGIVEGEQLEITFKQFTNVADVIDNTDVYDKIEGYSIVSPARAGKDVTENYNITVKFGTYEIARRTVTLTTGSEDIVYDGQPHSVEKYTDDGQAVNGETIYLVQGHIVVKKGTESFYSSFEDVKEGGGAYPNEPISDKWKVVDGDNNDVSDNYTVTWVSGKILITPRDMVIQIGSKLNALYDGEPHKDDTFEDKSAPKTFADLKQTLKITCKSFQKAGEYANELDDSKSDNYNIKKNAGNIDVPKRNYNITWLKGKAVIRQRTLVIKLKSTANWNWVYDGTSHLIHAGAVANNSGEYSLKYTDFEISDDCDKTIGSHEIYVKDCEKITEAGEYTAGSDGFKYEFVVRNASGSGGDVSYDYIITDNFAGTKLTIAKRKVSATSGDNTWVYTEGGKYSEHSATAKTRSGEEGILDGHSLTVLSSKEVSEITDVLSNNGKKYTAIGTIDNEVTKWKISDLQGIDRTDNYEVTWTWGKLRVKSPIKVMVTSRTITYDGTEKSVADLCKSYITILPPDVNKQDVKIQLVGSLTKPGKLTVGDILEASRQASSMPSPDENRIDFEENGKVLEITKKQLTIKTATVSAVHKNENSIYGNEYKKNNTIIGLISGHELSYELNAVLSYEESSVQNTVDIGSIKITDKNGEDVTDCYNIIVDAGTLSWVA